MSSQLLKGRVAAVGAVGAGAVLLIAGCSSSSSTPEESSAAPTPAATSAAPAATTIPPAPAGSTEITSKSVAEGATYTSYKTSETPANVVAAYDSALKADGFTITNEGSGGGGWGQYGGSEARVGGNKDGVFVEVNAGGEKNSTTYFEICQGPTSESVSKCQNGNHGDSSES